MKMQDLDAPAGVLIKTTLVDFPGRLASAFFLAGCNLRCPYCYNTDLVNIIPNGFISTNQLFEHLEKRKNVISALVISGGEPLLSPVLPQIIEKAKNLGYKIKLDTNGLLPEKLKLIVEKPCTKPDFIAMDIKTSPEKYNLLLKTSHIDEKSVYELLKASINIISKYPAENCEFRTVLVPPLVGMDDIKKIARLLPKDASWRLAPFRNERCLSKEYESIIPYTDHQMQELSDFARKLISDTILR